MLVVGRNGAGKTNLLEALHVGSQGFSPRTRSDAELIRFGESFGRVHLRGERGGAPLELEVTMRAGEGKRARANGAPLRTSELLRGLASVLVFTPDRLAVVKGGPAVRRAYFDRALGRLAPARSALPAEYGAAVAQRNAALRRVELGLSALDAIEPWTARVVELGGALTSARGEVVDALLPRFRETGAELGLPEAALRYEPVHPTVAAFEARLQADISRGTTGLGPHLDDVGIFAGARDLRSFGSQGEQRLSVLALLLAEADLLVERHGVPPLLLLDDVLSELDPDRRRRLASRISARGQAVVTSTTAESLPVEPAQIVEVEAGLARTVSPG